MISPMQPSGLKPSCTKEISNKTIHHILNHCFTAEKSVEYLNTTAPFLLIFGKKI